MPDIWKFKRQKKNMMAAIFACVTVALLIAGGCAPQTDTNSSPQMSDVIVTAENGGTLESQCVTAELVFDRPVSTGQDPLENMHITIAGEAVEVSDVSQSSENVITVSIPVTAVTTGNLVIEEKKAGNGYPGLTDETGSYAVIPFSVETLIPTGVSLEDDPDYTGNGVCKIVEGQWNIRCITWVQLIEDGTPLESAMTQTSELYRDNSVAIHGHDFLLCDETMIAEIMADTLNRHFGYRYVFYSEGNRIIGEKLEETDTGVPDLMIYNYCEIDSSLG